MTAIAVIVAYVDGKQGVEKGAQGESVSGGGSDEGRWLRQRGCNDKAVTTLLADLLLPRAVVRPSFVHAVLSRLNHAPSTVLHRVLV
jgi:hypothetical protein